MAKVAVTVRPETETLAALMPAAPISRLNAFAATVPPSSSASSKVKVTVFPFTDAETNSGPVVSPPTLPAGRSGKLGSAVPPLSFSTAPLAGLS